jgi:hypothetical protein
MAFLDGLYGSSDVSSDDPSEDPSDDSPFQPGANSAKKSLKGILEIR